MPLRNALNLGDGSSSDPAPITEQLVTNITQILAGSDPTTDDTYDAGAVFTAFVYAFRSLELRVAHINNTVLPQLRGDIGMLGRRVLALGQPD
jgi:hypothetical protein